MSDMKSRQQTDSKQGGEGTTSFNGKSYEFLSATFDSGQSQEPAKEGSKEGTK